MLQISKIQKNKILLFVGAGASAPFGFPTTIQFISGLKETLANTTLGLLLSNLLEVPQIQDVEQLLELLKAVKVFEKHPIKKFINKFNMRIHLPNLSNNLSDQMKLMEQLEDKIKSDIFRQYEFSPSEVENISKAYGSLIELISNFTSDNELSIFTTNYDRVIEEFCECNSYSYVDGFKRDPQTNELEWDSTVFDQKSKNEFYIKLHKLHGSLNWRRRYDLSVVKVAPEERTKGTKRYRENLLIFPAEKLTNEIERILDPEKEPFGEIHIRFREEFKKSNIAIFIGFNFRDEYINEIIGTEREGKKIIIISPNASEIKDRLEGKNSRVIRIWKKNTKIIPIDDYFGSPFLNETIKGILIDEI